MIEIEIFEDIKDQPTKLIGPFTTRQTVCAVAALGLGYITYKVMNGVFGEGNSYTWLAIMLVCIPSILLGWIKPYGLPFEKFANNMLFTYLIPPKKRLYKSVTTYDDFEALIEAEELAAQNAEQAKAKKSKTSKGKSKQKNKSISDSTQITEINEEANE